MTLANKIRNDLIEAYKGYYEDDRETAQAYEKEFTGQNIRQDFDQWLTERVKIQIIVDTPKERLAIYLEWNGILGYSDSIFDIAMGKLS